MLQPITSVTSYYFHYFLLRTQSGHTWRNKRLGPQETSRETAVLYIPELCIAPHGSTRFVSIGWVPSVLAQGKQCAPSRLTPKTYISSMFLQHLSWSRHTLHFRSGLTKGSTGQSLTPSQQWALSPGRSWTRTITVTYSGRVNDSSFIRRPQTDVIYGAA